MSDIVTTGIILALTLALVAFYLAVRTRLKWP